MYNIRVCPFDKLRDELEDIQKSIAANINRLEENSSSVNETRKGV